jgi:hypothetical protein
MIVLRLSNHSVVLLSGFDAGTLMLIILPLESNSDIFLVDIVVWDSHPLSLGATPTQVYVDGIAQLTNPYPLEKSAAFQELPETPSWDKEKNDTVKWEGVPPLTGRKVTGRVRLINVKTLIGFDEISAEHVLETVFDDSDTAASTLYPNGRIVVVEDGKIVCIQRPVDDCVSGASAVDVDEETVDLRGGAIAPGLTTYGAPIGLVEIRLEPSTNDGQVHDPLVDGDAPTLIAEAGLIRAVDGLAFEGRNAL